MKIHGTNVKMTWCLVVLTYFHHSDRVLFLGHFLNFSLTTLHYKTLYNRIIVLNIININ